jgi:hypothetical protein
MPKTIAKQSSSIKRTEDNEKIVRNIFLIRRLPIRMAKAWPERRLCPLERLLLFALFLNPWGSTEEALETATGASARDISIAVQNLVDWTLLEKREQGRLVTYVLSMGELEAMELLVESTYEERRAAAVRAAEAEQKDEQDRSFHEQAKLEALAWEMAKEILGVSV